MLKVLVSVSQYLLLLFCEGLRSRSGLLYVTFGMLSVAFLPFVTHQCQTWTLTQGMQWQGQCSPQLAIDLTVNSVMCSQCKGLLKLPVESLLPWLILFYLSVVNLAL